MRAVSAEKDRPTVEKKARKTVKEVNFGGLAVAFTSKIGSTCELGAQSVELVPGASSTCGHGACSCSSCCCW